MANIDNAYTVEILSIDDRVLIASGIIDPSIGGGYNAPTGSLYLRTNGDLYRKNNTADVDWVLVGIGGTDELVKVSTNDTTANTLINKLATGASITITETNDGGNETITIDTTIPISDIQVEIDNIEAASGGIFDTDGTFDPIVVDAALSSVTNPVDLLDALIQLEAAISTGTLSLNDLTDVILTGPITTNSSLQYNGTDWVNVPTIIPPPIGGENTIQLKFGPIAGISGTSQIPKDSSIPIISEGTEIWTDDIDIQSSTSTINIGTSITLSASTSSLEVIFAIFRNAVCIGVAVNSTSNKSSGFALSFEMYDTPGAIGIHTYSVRVGKPSGVSGTWFVNSIHRNHPINYFNGLLAQNSYSVAEIGTV